MMKRIMIKTHQLEDKSRVLNSRDKCSIHESQELRGFGNESEAYRDRPSYKLGYATSIHHHVASCPTCASASSSAALAGCLNSSPRRGSQGSYTSQILPTQI